MDAIARLERQTRARTRDAIRSLQAGVRDAEDWLGRVKPIHVCEHFDDNGESMGLCVVDDGRKGLDTAPFWLDWPPLVVVLQMGVSAVHNAYTMQAEVERLRDAALRADATVAAKRERRIWTISSALTKVLGALDGRECNVEVAVKAITTMKGWSTLSC